MKLITETEADKTKHVFAGMWRLPWHEFVSSLSGGYLFNKDMSKMYHTMEDVRAGWIAGDFDTALYRDPDEHNV